MSSHRLEPLDHRLYHHKRTPGPWPWSDFFGTAVQPPNDGPVCGAECDHKHCSEDYAESLCSGWKSRQEVAELLNHASTCSVYHVDVKREGELSNPYTHTVVKIPPAEGDLQGWLRSKPEEGFLARILFVDNLSERVLQMLGTRYNIDPDFFRFCIDREPSQSSDRTSDQGDHIRITLPFLCLKRARLTDITAQANSVPDRSKIPRDNITLDLLGIYMIRDPDGGTIICYHPPPKPGFTSSTAHNHSWIQRIGQDNHWKNIFRLYDEPTFALLPILWYVVYAWADALNSLYLNLNTLEAQVLETTNMRQTQELHQIRVRLLSYKTLLTDFYKSVVFLINTPNPNVKLAMSDRSYNPYPYGTINLVSGSIHNYSTSQPGGFMRELGRPAIETPQRSRSLSLPPVPWSSESENDKEESNEHSVQERVDVNDAQEQGGSWLGPEEVADGSEVEEGDKVPKPVPQSKQGKEEANGVGEQYGADTLEEHGCREGAPQKPKENMEGSHSLGAAEAGEEPWKQFTPSFCQGWGPDATVNFPTQRGRYQLGDGEQWVADAHTKVRTWMGDNGGDNGGNGRGRKKLEQDVFEMECKRLLDEIIALKEGISTRNERIKDVMNMVFSNVTVRDCTAMRQILLFFIPATFITSVFGMNVSGISTDSMTLADIAIPFIAVTIWVLVAFQIESETLSSRLWWPIAYFSENKLTKATNVV